MKASFSFLSLCLSVVAAKELNYYAVPDLPDGNYHVKIKPVYSISIPAPVTETQYLEPPLEVVQESCQNLIGKHRPGCGGVVLWAGADLIHCDGKTMEN